MQTNTTTATTPREELTALAQKIETYRADAGIPKTVFCRQNDALGSVRTYDKILAAEDDLNEEKWLEAYRAVWSRLQNADLEDPARQTIGVVADVRQIERKLVDDERDDDIAIAEARKLRAEIDRARQAARYQADKLDPAKMAKRKAWMDANPEKVAEYRRRNRERNRDRNRKYAADFARRQYHTDPEAARAKARAWYQCNRDRILARLKQQREEARKSRKGGQS